MPSCRGYREPGANTFPPLRGSFSTPNQPTEAREIPYWHPSYLDWPVLAAFSITFSTLAVSCQVLLYYSNKSYGLATSYQDLHYLWTYGPTAILTLLASFWERVAFQAKISAPWCRMLKGPATSQQSVLLNYVSQFQPFAIYTAAKNKDYPVAASTLVSLLLQLVIVISTSFIVLSPIDIRMEDVEVTLKSQFVNDPSRLLATSDLAFSSLTALLYKDISLPEGISAKYAYITAETNIQNISQLVMTVDAFEGGLHCEPAAVTPVWGEILTTNGPPSFKILRLKSDNCEMTVMPNCGKSENLTCTSLSISPEKCHGPNSTDKRAIGIVASSVMDTPNSPINSTPDPNTFHINITVIWANSFICTPFYHIIPIETLRTNAGIQISSVVGTTSRQLSSVSPWDIWDAHARGVSHISSSARDLPDLEFGTQFSGEQVFLDQYSLLGLRLANYTHSEILPNISSMVAGDNIVRLISSYYQQYTAILAQVSLMKDASTPSTGSAIVSKQRLVVQIVPTHIMTGLLLLSVTSVAIIWWWQSKLFLPQNPNTIIGNAVLLAHSPLRLAGIGAVSVSDLEAMLDYSVYRIGEVDTAATSNRQLFLCINQIRPMNDDIDVRKMKRSTFRPLSLSITFRSFAFLLIISVIVTLEISSRKSEHDDGIVDTPEERSINYQLWTVFPGLLSTLISMYTASVDADTRSQGHLLQLRRGATFEALSLDLLDWHTSTLVLEEIRSRSFESLASTLAVVSTSLSTIFSASLFFTTTFLAETHVQLKPSNLIYYNPDSDYYGYPAATQSNSVGMMLLLENASYPVFTYQDLVFPGLVLDSTPPSHFAQSKIVYNVTVLAVRPAFSNCRLYDASQIDVSIGSASPTGGNYLEVIIHPEAVCGTIHYEQIWIGTTAHGYRYFGGKYDSSGFGCSRHIWTWGSWTNVSADDTKARIRSIHALACNDTLQTVETSVEFIAQTMAVNSDNPPIANYASAVNLTSTHPLTYLDFYQDLPQITTTESNADLDSFFAIITSSRYAIPTPYLGDSSKISAVIDSIHFHHRILLVQLLDQEWRYENRSSAASANSDIRPVWDKPTVFNATARDPYGRSRVMQDMVSTRVLQSFLAATLVCLGINWFLMRNVDIVPRSPTSIANWIALLADGNFYDCLPPDAGLMPLDQISRWYFGQDAVFYLGFIRKPPVSNGQELLGIYVVSQHSVLGEPEERRP